MRQDQTAPARCMTRMHGCRAHTRCTRRLSKVTSSARPLATRLHCAENVRAGRSEYLLILQTCLWHDSRASRRCLHSCVDASGESGGFGLCMSDIHPATCLGFMNISSHGTSLACEWMGMCAFVHVHNNILLSWVSVCVRMTYTECTCTEYMRKHSLTLARKCAHGYRHANTETYVVHPATTFLNSN
jgi:hypothetical protein